ncbi:hypothetical protein [Kitasatospora sp. NPDC088351]|uniref:hypothetical protein n=1 Tax=Kitasatospora sp. NPDC088351 TaxID=3155180 RepID=UPI00341881E5
MDVVVAGQGYVGLPLAVRAAEVGHRVVGHDVNPHRIKQLTAGDSYVEDVASSRLRAVLDTGAQLRDRRRRRAGRLRHRGVVLVHRRPVSSLISPVLPVSADGPGPAAKARPTRESPRAARPVQLDGRPKLRCRRSSDLSVEWVGNHLPPTRPSSATASGYD